MYDVPFATYWNKGMVVKEDDFAKGSNGFERTVLVKDVNDFFVLQEKIHKDACKEYGELLFQIERIDKYRDAKLVPREWKQSFAKTVAGLEGTERADAMVAEFKVRTHEMEADLKVISPRVFYTVQTSDWCQQWVEKKLGRSFASPDHMYASVRKSIKATIHHFLVECKDFFREAAVSNVFAMIDEKDARMMMLEKELEVVRRQASLGLASLGVGAPH